MGERRSACNDVGIGTLVWKILPVNCYGTRCMPNRRAIKKRALVLQRAFARPEPILAPKSSPKIS